MTCCHIFGIDIVSKCEQPLPLDISVAGYAWVRCQSFDVRFDERSRNMLSELRKTVYIIKRYLKLSGYLTGIAYLAAAAVRTAFSLPGPQRYAYHLIALLLQ